MAVHPLIVEDLQGVLLRQSPHWTRLKHAHIFITGATGFFGTWLLELLRIANREFSLGCRLTALSRNPARNAAHAGHLLSDPAITWLAGDVRSFPFPDPPITHVIHAASEVHTALRAGDARSVFDVCVDGTRRVVDLAATQGVQRFLFTSSGAVYGSQPPRVSHIPETFLGGPDPLRHDHAYAEGKRAAELLCSLAVADGRLEHASIARCFSFVGPYQPLNAPFAVANFMRDAIAGGAIRLDGDGTPLRGYLYAADLAEWLLMILIRGRSGVAYNVGGEETVSIRGLADHVAALAAEIWPLRTRCTVAAPHTSRTTAAQPDYVPDCTRAREELSLRAVTTLDHALRRTLLWHDSRS